MSQKRAHTLQKSLVFLVTVSLLIMVVSSFTFAAKGDFSTTFVAAAPLSYDHTTGGGAYDDGTIGRDKDIVTSLESSDFKRYDIVTYFYKIAVNPTTTDKEQVVEIDFEFTGNTTGQPGAAFYDIEDVQINKGAIQDLIPGENNIEDAHFDPDDDTVATLSDEQFIGTIFTPKALLKGTVRVDNLDAGDVVVVRVDVKLDYKLGAAPTGNLQASVSEMRLVEMNGQTTDQNVSIGRQTVPFKITDIRFPGVSIVKTTRDLFGIYGDGVLVETGAEVKWRYDVTNSGETNLQNIRIDDNQIGGTSDATFAGEISGDGDSIFEPGEVWRYEAVGTAIAGAYSNIGTVYADDSSGSPVTPASDPSSYTGVKPEIQITKMGDKISKVGDEIEYTIKVKNVSTVNLPVSGTVTDTKLGLSWSFSNLAKDAEVTVPAAQTKYTVQTGDDEAEPTGWVDFTNTASVTVTFTSSTGTASDTETSSWTTKLVHPKIELTKTANRDHTVIGDEVTYTIKIENIGDINLYNVAVSDPMASGFSPSAFPTTLAIGADASRTFTHTVAASDVSDGKIANTATVTSNPTTVITDVTYTLTNNITDNDSVNLDVYAPKMKVTKTLVAEPFKSTVYTLLVENLSTAGTPDLDVTVYDPKLGINTTFTLAAGASKNDFTFAVSGSTDQPSVTARFYLQGTSVYVDFGGEP